MPTKTLAEVGSRIDEIRAEMAVCRSSLGAMRELDRLILERETLIQARRLSQTPTLARAQLGI